VRPAAVFHERRFSGNVGDDLEQGARGQDARTLGERACGALPSGRTNARPAARAESAIGAPRTARSSPVRESSPANSWPASSSAASWPLAAKTPSAIGRSNRLESFGNSAGARLTVMRRAGNSKCTWLSAARTRSRASRTSASGNPTMWNAGRPGPRCTSTLTSGASMPASARLATVATVMVPLREDD
jgi:hypothetical protein